MTPRPYHTYISFTVVVELLLYDFVCKALIGMHSLVVHSFNVHSFSLFPRNFFNQ